MEKPEILISAGSKQEIEAYLQAGADAISIGEQQFGLRMPGNFQQQDMQELISHTHQMGGKAYVSVNHLIDNNQLTLLTSYLNNLVQWGADALVFGDPAVLQVCREENLQLALHWNAEMTSTNFSTARFWQGKGASRVVLARELNLEEIHEAKRQLPDMEVQIQVHGMTNIYHSRRNLVQSYMQHRQPVAQENQQYGMDQNLYLIEQERRNLKLPVFEDGSGTHIMSADDLCYLESIDEILQQPIDSFKIEGLLKPMSYNEVVIRKYRQAIDAFVTDPEHYEFDDTWLESIEALQPPGRELSFGFLFKEQVY